MTDSLPLIGSVDVVVIGGGPAGASLGLALRTHTNRSVTLIESTGYDTVRLGENVSSAILPLLDYLDVKQAFLEQASHIENFTVLAAWGHDLPLPQHSVRHWSGEGYLLERSRFDVMLAEYFHRRGGTLYLSCGTDEITRDEKGYLLHLRHTSGRSFALHARYIVDATGRKASIARRLGAISTVHDALIGVSRFFQMDAALPYSRDIVIESMRDGWWYSAPLSDNRLVVTLMTDATLWRHTGQEKSDYWDHALRQGPHTYARLQHAAIACDDTITVRSAHSHLLNRTYGENWLAVGDAAVSFDPLSSLGIGFAIHSASHAARALDYYLDTQDQEGLTHYDTSIKIQFNSYLPMWRNYYSHERRYLEAAFWKTRRQHLER